MPHALVSRRLATGLFALAPLLSPVPAPAASAPAAPAALKPAVSPAGPLWSRPGVTVTGTGWAGYTATGSTYTSVTTTFNQPAVKCSSGDTYSSFWAGLDGYSSDTVEQVGTEADCEGKTAEYYAWYELYPAYPVTLSATVKPGDAITVTVAFSGTDTFTFTVKNATEGWTETAKKTASGTARSSAEIIVESPESTLPLADFGSVAFSGCKVDGEPLGSFDPIATDSPGLTVSPITDGTEFTVTWSEAAAAAPR
jgi:hypothetical protein